MVDSIDWKKVKDAHALYVAGEVYAANRLYQESKAVFLMAYDRLPVRKNILYRLVEVSIKTGELQDAWEYYKRFLEASPNDDVHYVLKYKIYSAQGAPLEEQIQILEEYKERDYTERWSYELAKLYYKAGEAGKCVETCDDIVLWFSEGVYVKKALELKQRLTNLTPRQRDIYETMIRPEETAGGMQEPTRDDPEEDSGGYEDLESPEEIKEEAGEPQRLEEEVIESGISDGRGADREMAPIMEDNDSLQEKISKGIKDIFAGIVREWEGEDDILEGYPGTPKINIADVIPVEHVEESIREKEADQEEAEKAPDTEKDQEKPKRTLIKMPFPKKIEEEPAVDSSPGPLQENPANVPDPAPFQEEAGDISVPELSQEETEDVSAPAPPQEEIADASAPESLQEEPASMPQVSQIQGSSQDGEDQDKEDQDKESSGLKAPAEKKEDGGFDVSKLPKLELPEFNLEEVILSAAEKQGIEVPDIEDVKGSDDPKEKAGEKPEEDHEEKPGEGSGEEIEKEVEEGKGMGSEEPEESEESHPVIDKIQPEGEIRPQEDLLSEEESLIQFIEEKDSQEDQDTVVRRNMTLDDVELKLFSYFSVIPGMKEQLVEALADAQRAAADKTSRSGNIIVMGNKRTGKTRLIEGMIRAVCRELHMPAARVAIVGAEQINGKDMPKIVSRLAGGFLVIMKASQLLSDSVVQLDQALEFRTDGLTVILEDEKIGMRKFIAKYEKFAKKFTSTINIPVFTNDELVHFAKIYADEMGYVMDTMGVLALYNLIGDNQKEDEPMTIGTVKDMMDVAITKAESSHRKLQRSISKKRFDDEGKIILYEKDFK